MRPLLILPLLALIGACTSGPPSQATLKYNANEAARLDKALAGLAPGKPQSCIPLREAQGTESFGNGTLLFRVSKKLVYRNETHGSCNQIGNGRALVTRTYSSDLCRGDIGSAADLVAGFETGSCVMGDFVPYRKTTS
jgi:hypothetical protein